MQPLRSLFNKAFGYPDRLKNGMPFPGYSGFLDTLSTGVYRPLYNGNISSSSVYQKKFEDEVGGPLIFYNYKYDQLNRLTAQDTYNGFLRDQNKWNNMSSMGERAKERVAYDANGNIQRYLRKSMEGGIMDSLKYHYYANTNQLRRITDSVPANAYVHNGGLIVDIDNQSDSNYIYDSIGNLITDKQENIDSIKWNVYGKIAEIARRATDTVPASNIKYTYDAMGNRISQVVTSNGTKRYTWYVRDAQGNILSTYTAEGNDTNLENLKLNLADRFIYGSSRLGTITVNDDNVDGGPGNTEYFYEGRAFAYGRGYKNYELTNHLGNVLATVSDRKFGVSSGGSSLIDYYEPHIVTAQDYYPFGMLSRVSLPGNDKSYAFGFNGKMNDNDVKGGLGNQQDYGMRIYDGRVGRFLSVDPISKNYPELTPYQYASNRPIWAVDLDGLESALMGPGMTHNTAGRALGEYLNEPAPLWMKRTLAAQANYESRGVELTEDDYEGTTRGGFYLLSAGFSLSRWAQSNPGTLKIPNTRRLPQQPDVEVPNNTARAKQGVTVQEEIPQATNKQADPNDQIALAGGNKVKVINEDGSNFGIKNINKIGGNKNCAYCVIATDHYLKTGYPVSALNKKEGTSPLVLEKFFGAKFTYGLSIDQVSKRVSKAGQMGIVYGLINSKEAHVFNVINQNGKVSFIDGQSGGKAKLTGYKWFGFMPTN